VSVFLLYGMIQGWYLRTDYSRWMKKLHVDEITKKIFEFPPVRYSIYLLVTPLTLISFILLGLHLQILGRNLGYW
jgi:hypothetical protein